MPDPRTLDIAFGVALTLNKASIIDRFLLISVQASTSGATLVRPHQLEHDTDVYDLKTITSETSLARCVLTEDRMLDIS